MRVRFHRDFRKRYQRLPRKVQSQFDRRLGLFIEDLNHPLLNLHALSGERWPLMSINVTGDYRALFVFEKDTAVFYEIGTHSELYS